MAKGRAILVAAVGALLLVLASGAAWAAMIQCSPDERRCVGTDNPDSIYGTDDGTDDDNDEFEDIRGREGADRIYGRGGDDREYEVGGGLHGDDGEDVVRDGGGDDSLFGGNGPDRLYGGPGNDSLKGEKQLSDGRPASDRMSGGASDDFVDALDSRRDRIYCGPGRDTVYADDREGGGHPDVVDDSCEEVTRR